MRKEDGTILSEFTKKELSSSIEENSDLLTVQKYFIILSWQSFKPQHNPLLDSIIEFFSCFVLQLNKHDLYIYFKKKIQQFTVEDIYLQSKVYECCYMSVEQYTWNYFKHCVIGKNLRPILYELSIVLIIFWVCLLHQNCWNSHTGIFFTLIKNIILGEEDILKKKRNLINLSISFTFPPVSSLSKGSAWH